MSPSKADTSSDKPSAIDLDSSEMGCAPSKVKSSAAAVEMGCSKKDAPAVTLKISLKKGDSPFSGVVIGVSGKINGYTHTTVRDMVENAGAKFSEDANVAECTHLVVDVSLRKVTKKMEEAKEQETCEIVYLTWLLKSIKQGRPLATERYRVWRERAVKAPDSTGNRIKTVRKGSKKRKLEDDVEHKDYDPWDHLVDDWAIVVSLINIVDPIFATRVTRSVVPAVWMHGDDIFDATLVRILDAEHQKNSKHHYTCRIQLLCDVKSKRYTTWVNNDLDPKLKAESSSVTWGDFATAHSAFEEAFKTASGLSWEDRNSKLQPDMFTFVTCERKSNDFALVDVHPGETELTLSVEACNALKVIVNRDNAGQIKATLEALSYNFTLFVGNVIERQRLEFGMKLLNKLLEILGSRKNSHPGPYAAELGRLYREALYHPKKTHAGLDLRSVQAELESLKYLLNLTAAQEIVEQSVNYTFEPTAQQLHPTAQQLHRVLALKHITTVQKSSTEYEHLANYFTKSIGGPHQKAKITNIFRIERPGEAERFAQWREDNKSLVGIRRLLWHGSHSVNFIGILNQGLRMHAQGPGNGCSGIFFADFAGKSLGFCRIQRGSQALILLCEVELGKREYSDGHPAYQTLTPGLRAQGYLSRLIKGRRVFPTWQNAKPVHDDLDGVLMPDVSGGKENLYDGAYGHNEYVVDEPGQILQRYLFHVQLC